VEPEPTNNRRAAARQARALRRALTPAESVLWRELRDHRLGGYKFRRQQPVGPYYADFCCSAARVIVELDGDSHVGRELRDAARTAYLNSEGYVVLRFWNPEVFENLDGVLEAILTACTARVPASHSVKAPPPGPLDEDG
jgi:very-short-patch-repair endonuclease